MGRYNIIHISHILFFPHLDPSPTTVLSFSLSLLLFIFYYFYRFWIQLQVTHLTLSSSFRLKHRLFMNFARLVHNLCSIRLYENGLIKELKHKNQCPIYNASPIYFEIFSWKPIWTCIWNESWHLEVHIFSFFGFFKVKKVTKFYLNTSKSFTCPITNPILNVHSLPSWGFAPSFKSLIHFYLSFSNGPCP